MIATWRQFRSFGHPARVLYVNEFGMTAALLMLGPYLADHLVHRIGLAVWLGGLILGARHFSEGVFLVGSTLADRVGYKPMIIAGCLLKAAACLMFAMFESVPWLFGASALTGLASALFIPAARAYLACHESERTVDAFAMFGVCRRAGVLIGPLVGVPLVAVDFRLVCLTAAVLCAGLAVSQARLLPACAGTEAGSDRPIWSDWSEALRNRAFVGFAVSMFASYALMFQITFGLPLEIRRVTGGQTWVTALFVISAVLGLAGQVRLITWCERRWTAGQAMFHGLIVMGASFLPLTVLPVLHGGPVVRVIPILICGLILTVGTMMVFPFEMATIAHLAEGRLIGTYYGLNNLLSGVGILFGNMLSGLADGLARATGIAGLPWLLLFALGLLSAAGLKVVDRGDRLSATPTARSPVG
ncbi:MAG: MFS transporter [Actinomadura sp.]